jgi:Protein of unknown function (DUF3102)
MRTKAKRRDLTIITGELRTALKRETTSIIEVGALLVEAKKQVMHGEWLPWLENEFSLSERSAQRYLLVGRFAAKYDSLSDLNLTAEALYALSSPHNYVTPEVITAVLEEAKEKRVGEGRVWEIAAAMLPKEADEQPDEQPDGQPAAAAQAAAEDAEATLDDPPPDLPPSSEPPPPVKPPPELPDELVNVFRDAVEALKPLVTKKAARFVGLVASSDLIQIADFLNMVAKLEMEKRGNDGPTQESADEMKNRMAAPDSDLDVRSFNNGILRRDHKPADAEA